MESIRDVDVRGKKVIVRVDFNVPRDKKTGEITDDTRIVASLDTINYLVKNGAKVILLSHLGKVKSNEDKEKNSLGVVAERLRTLIDVPVYFTGDTRGHAVEAIVNNVLDGEIVLLENTRYEDFPKKLESSCDEALSKYWASFGDIFVLEAFGSAHRCHASTYGISKYLPSYAGFLVEKETEILNEVLQSSRTLIMGGSKIDEKIAVIENLIPTSDSLLVGGGMCFTFLKAMGYNIGKSLLAEEQIDYCKDLLERYGNKIVLPVDVVTQNGVKNVNELNDDDIGYDIGPKTVKLFQEVLSNSNMVLWNGPLGMYEEEAYANGTKDVLEFLEQQDFKTILGGGNIVDAATQFGVNVHHKCTGGGSTLEYLGGARFKTLSRLKGDK